MNMKHWRIIGILTSLFLFAPLHAAELNVKNFGAKADAATDDTAAIQKALDTAAANHGGRVFLPAGKYMLKGHLSIPNGVILAGIGEAPPTLTTGIDNQ